MSPATRTRVIGVCALLGLATLVATCQRSGLVVDRNIDYSVWSRDGRAVYYSKDSLLLRYDLDTGNKQSFSIPDIAFFDISPDERKVVHLRYEHRGVYVTDLQTGNTEIVHRTKTDIFSVYWISKDTVAFGQLNVPGKEGADTYMLDLQSKLLTRFNSGSAISFRALDGSGFVYEDEQFRFHYYDLKRKNDIPLKACPPSASEWTVEFIYLDAKRAVYHIWATTGPDSTEVLDLATMRTRRVVLPHRVQTMAISPDLQRYWRTGPHMGHEAIKLYLVDIPPATVKQLKAPVK